MRSRLDPLGSLLQKRKEAAEGSELDEEATMLLVGLPCLMLRPSVRCCHPTHSELRFLRRQVRRTNAIHRGISSMFILGLRVFRSPRVRYRVLACRFRDAVHSSPGWLAV